MQEISDFDAIVLGSGLGGLLSAVQLLERGRKVVVLERLGVSGGRFSAKLYKGAQVSTGAVHMLPFGSGGVLAQMLRQLRIPHQIHDADVFAGFHVNGKHYISHSPFDVWRFLGLLDYLRLASIGMKIWYLRPKDGNEPFGHWLRRQTTSSRLWAFFTKFANFALSIDLEDFSYDEAVLLTRNMFHYGVPGIVHGGCAAITRELERAIVSRGGEIRLKNDVYDLVVEDAQMVGVRVHDKARETDLFYRAATVVSDIGLTLTTNLVRDGWSSQRTGGRAVLSNPSSSEARGIKFHLLSDTSLIPHKSILFPLDAKRIGGIVQPSNCDPALAPPGKHLLITHQVLRGDDLETEKALALDDLRTVFPDFDKHCEVLAVSAYRNDWPVNRLAQGSEVGAKTPIDGLYLVGDAVNPRGYLMVEGVAQGVTRMLDLLEKEPVTSAR